MKTYKEKYLKYKTKYLNLKALLDNNFNKNNFVQNGGASPNKTLVLIKADWCGHCQAFKQIWEQLPSEIENINFKVLDSEQNKDIIQGYNIKGYPSIFLESEQGRTEFEGKRELSILKKFIKNN